MKFLGREPALWMSLFSSLVMFVSAFLFPLSPEQQGVLNACCTAAFGLLAAWFIARDGLSAAILGFFKSILALAIAFGLHMSTDKQAIVMMLVSGLVAMFLRTQVTASVTADGGAGVSIPRTR